MTYYNKIKKLDLESAEQMQEGTGPTDECLCSLLAAPEDDKRSIAGSIKKAFAAIGGTSRGRKRSGKGGSVDIPLTFTKGGKGLFTTKQAVQRQSPCGKCSCDSTKFVLKSSDMNIRIISPDVSTICPCPNDCLPNKASLANNIKVTVEHMKIDPDPDMSDSEYSLNNTPDTEQHEQLNEPTLTKLSVTDLINAQFDIEEIDENDFKDDVSQWSFGDHDPDEKSYHDSKPHSEKDNDFGKTN